MSVVIASTQPTHPSYSVNFLIIDEAVVAVVADSFNQGFEGAWTGLARHRVQLPVTEAQRRAGRKAVQSEYAALEDELHYNLNRAPWPRFGDDV